MTSLGSWRGTDSRGASSLYIVTDSRFTWPNGSFIDSGRKTFVSPSSPDVFGYCGDVRLPKLVLTQLEESGLLGNSSAQARHIEFLRRLESAMRQHPSSSLESFAVVHGARDGAGMTSTFQAWCTTATHTTVLADVEERLPLDSTLAFALGSGQNAVRREDRRWNRSEVGRTSRAVFSGFCDSLNAGSDKNSGGAPQVVALFRSGPAEHIGVIYGGTRYLRGQAVGSDEVATTATEWRNELFERCDPVTMTLLTGGQRHARPKGVDA